ncbi:MAG: hypothetical protein H8D34_15625, partial [Chloroflexi bacterium]|nr:hypothetical protein [Chloroflexota bacterium]
MSMKLIQTASEHDWPWIIEHHAATAWASLSPELQSAVNIQTVRASLDEQVPTFRAEHGVTNQVFISRIADQNVVYLWVGQFRRVVTG